MKKSIRTEAMLTLWVLESHWIFGSKSSMVQDVFEDDYCDTKSPHGHKEVFF